MLLAVLLSSVLLGGCWDSKDLGDEAFVTGIGVDYEKGAFVVSLQLFDFGAIAKTESATPGPANVWIGKASGKSVTEAILNLSLSAQIELTLEQLKVVVIREPAMFKMDEILDALNRVRVSRYTAWIFGTRGQIEDVFASNTFFERSQLASMLYNPEVQYKQNSTFKPVTMQKFVSDYNERAETALLPSLTIDRKSWRQRKKLMEMEEVDGVFAFKYKD
ncbi:hypothetical protein I8J29_17895 [Paenibacillus sp. MWE-103]|uniref:Spore germination protein N-terminal domain-containing protein n=1 Tax=Paenibacillus artemisiicola TaxID=1172618 RepID=A0ABS3WCN2_9BACL|nr:hypothetical protein [Paenibacillus artemisiicola]MBO7746086.1 hypothetical protein [Paenibacillus artemisiicola]